MIKSKTNLCIKHLPSDFEKQDLIRLCSQFGSIRSAKIMFDLKTGISKEFGFIRFESPLSAALALEKLNGLWISKKTLNPADYKANNECKKISVSYAKSDENTGKKSNEIKVSSLPLYFVKEDIYDLFSKYGKIVSIEMINDTKRNRYHGRAIITYRTNEEAEFALKSLNNIKLSDDSWPLFIQFENKSQKKENKCINNDEKSSDDSDSFAINSEIKIQRPRNNESMVQKKIITENFDNEDEDFYKKEQYDTFMFKLIAEEY